MCLNCAKIPGTVKSFRGQGVGRELGSPGPSLSHQTTFVYCGISPV